MSYCYELGDHRRPITTDIEDAQIWFDPKTTLQLTRCPWLIPIENSEPVKYGCAIYFDRPEDCRLYPSRIDEMQRDGCEMLEVKDLKKPKQAQQALDRMMEDSR